MGLSGISIWQLLIVLAIVVMLFGTKRVRNLGSDLGEAIKGFRSSITDDASEKIDETRSNGDVIDSTLEETSKTKEGK